MKKIIFVALAGLLIAATSCKREDSSKTTGWLFNKQEWGGVEKTPDYKGQATGPNLVHIEGGTFNMGITEEDPMFDYRNIGRRVTVSSFYMDETEVANLDWLEYLQFLVRVYPTTPEIYIEALPDTLVWHEELAFNDPYVENYLRHPAYMDYPVVGVSWLQVQDYCKWRTDRVNEMILIKEGKIDPTSIASQSGQNTFNTGAYYAGIYSVQPGPKPMINLSDGNQRNVRFEDGILLPAYRLPTEAEWEFAALALLGNQSASKDERITDRRIYPWDGTTTRYPMHGRYQGLMVANFKRGRGDYMGMAGALNDNASITAPVRSYVPNDYGLYNMAGNVNEWVQDVYRPMTSTTLRDVESQDLNSFRGNIFTQVERDATGKPSVDQLGRIKYKELDSLDIADRLNFQKSNVINYLDGDPQSKLDSRKNLEMYDVKLALDQDPMAIMTDNSRVYKGGSWEDRSYWLSPGARRYLDQSKSSRALGFRCAMHAVGSPKGNKGPGGNVIKTPGKRTKRKY